jgi:putative NADH-flavin reductase
MKVALFGATGGTGLEFLKQSQGGKDQITVFARSTQSLTENFKEIQVIKASIDDQEFLLSSVKDFDVIVSIVGIAGLLQARKPGALYERTAKTLIRIAKENRIPKTIVVTSGGVMEAPGEPWIMKYILKPFFLKNMYEDMKVMEKLISDSDLNFTIVRPPYLTNGPLTKKYRTIVNDWFMNDKDLSRADLAHYLLSILGDTTLNRKFVGISN